MDYNHQVNHLFVLCANHNISNCEVTSHFLCQQNHHIFFELGVHRKEVFPLHYTGRSLRLELVNIPAICAIWEDFRFSRGATNLVAGERSDFEKNSENLGDLSPLPYTST